MNKLLTHPIFFEKNRVYRVYTGGALFADFFGDESQDGFEPEEWVVSSVVAMNTVMKTPKDGVSRVKGTDIYFDDLLTEHRQELLGDRKEFGVLTKVLDSAIRLPVQAHPDKAFSRKHFGSDYGKAESWIVLACRPDAALYFGFNREVTRDEFRAAIAESETDRRAMERLLNRIDVKPGDVFFVPAKMVHAIGYGCLILEIQEPSDFTVQPEFYCGDHRLNDKEMYMELDHELALDVFDFSLYGEEAIARGRREPKLLQETDGVRVEELITYEDTPCFAAQRTTLTAASTRLTHKPAVYVVTDGVGTLTCDGEVTPLRKGDYFFLPYSATETTLASDLSLSFITCLPPLV